MKFSQRPYVMSERGAIIPLLAVILLLLAGFEFFLLSYGYMSVVQTELQVAADAAAHAGALRLCAVDHCWNESRLAAIHALEKQSLFAGVGQKSTFALDSSLSHGPTWGPTETGLRNTGLHITIERGRYIPSQGANEASIFLQMETPASGWQSRFPGIPRSLLVNAVRVEIRRENVVPFLPPSFRFGFTVTRNSAALADPLDAHQIAPFAIPVCALLNDSGAYDLTYIHAHDRLFTQADRYCPPADPSCDPIPIPSFRSEPYNWVDNLDPGTYGGTGSPADVRQWYCTISHLTAAQCDDFWDRGLAYGHENLFYWKSSGYATRTKSFGVVGLPDKTASSALTVGAETTIRDVISLRGGTVTARIGDYFRILPAGLTEFSSDSVIWNKIVNGGTPWEKAPYGPNARLWIKRDNIKLRTDAARPANEYCTYQFHGNIADCGTPKSDYGLCSGHRHPLSLQSNTWPCMLNDDNTNAYQPVWVVDVAVIADASAGVLSCKGLGAAKDPMVDPNHHWVIIGFMRTAFFDNDIGREYPTVGALPVPGKTLAGDNYFAGCSTANDYNFGFIGADPTSDGEECNLVRGRFAYETDIIASVADDRTARHPVLIEPRTS